MSIATEAKVNELEARVAILEKRVLNMLHADSLKELQLIADASRLPLPSPSTTLKLKRG